MHQVDQDVVTILERASALVVDHHPAARSSWRGVDAVRRAARDVNAEAFTRAVTILLGVVRAQGLVSSDAFALTATPEQEQHVFAEAVERARQRRDKHSVTEVA